MTIRRVVSEHVAEPQPETWSNCRVIGNQLFTAGMTAADAGGDEFAQARAIFGKIRHLVETAGGEMNDIAKVNIFVTNIGNREEVWRARREFFTGDFPVSTLVEVSALATPEMLVEIEAVGFIGEGAA